MTKFTPGQKKKIYDVLSIFEQDDYSFDLYPSYDSDIHGKINIYKSHAITFLELLDSDFSKETENALNNQATITSAGSTSAQTSYGNIYMIRRDTKPIDGIYISLLSIEEYYGI